MKGLKIFINNKPTDFQNVSIKFSDTKINFNELDVRNSPFTYAFSLPTTNRNNEIFENINLLNVVGKFIKDFNGEIYFNDDLILEGNVLIREITKESYELNLVSDNLIWANTMSNKSLNDLTGYTEAFTAHLNSTNSDLSDGNDFESFLNSNDRKMNFPLNGYGNFFQKYKAGLYEVIDGVVTSNKLSQGLYQTDVESVFYIAQNGYLLPSRRFDDGELITIDGFTNQFQVIVENPNSDNYIGDTEFTFEELLPSFYVNPLIKEIFKQNGFTVNSDIFYNTRNWVLPYVNSTKPIFNWGLLGQVEYNGLVISHTHPQIGTNTVGNENGFDNITLNTFKIFDPSSIPSPSPPFDGIYRTSIGSEPCCQYSPNTGGGGVSVYDNYKDAVYKVGEEPEETYWDWYGYMFLFNLMNKTKDYTENYVKYNNINIKDNFTPNGQNFGHFYRCPVSCEYNYQISFELETIPNAWNTQNKSEHYYTNEPLPFYFVIMKGNDFETELKNLWNGDDFSDNVLFSENLLNVNNQLKQTSFNFNLNFDLQENDELTPCFFSFQTSTPKEPSGTQTNWYRVTNLHYYLPCYLKNSTLSINPIFDTDFDIAKNLPNISQIDFIKEFIKLNNLFVIKKNKQIYLTSFDNYYLDSNIKLENVKYNNIEPLDVYNKFNFKYTQDTNDYLVTDETRPESVKIDFVNYSTNKLNNTSDEYTFTSTFSPTTTRNYLMYDLSNNLNEIELSTLSSEQTINTDPRFVNYDYNFKPRILEYNGLVERKIKVYDEWIQIGVAKMPQELYMKNIYVQKYNRLYEKNNLSNKISVTLYMSYIDYLKLKNNLPIINYQNDKYYIADLIYTLPKEEIELTLIKKI